MTKNDDPAQTRHRSPIEDAATLSAALQRVADGDRKAFAYVYQRTSAKLFGTCLRILSERHEAEEALQEAYLSIWRKAGSFDPGRGAAVTWLVAVTRNCAIDRLRTSRPIAAEPLVAADDVADLAPLAPEALVTSQEQDRLAACVRLLENGDAVLIRAAFLQGSTYSELAERSATPLGTVKSRIRRALLKLRDCLR